MGNSERPLDTTGYSLERARQILQEAGLKIATVTRVGPAPTDTQDSREMVIRQIAREAGSVELVVSRAWAVAKRAETTGEQ